MPRHYNLHNFFDEKAIAHRLCDQTGCHEKGEYRAPISPTQLHDYHWFCLQHVREYNLNWDYYKQLSQQDIERLYNEDVTWQRPTWKFGFNQSSYSKFSTFFREDFFNSKYTQTNQKHAVKALIDSEQAHAFALFELDQSADITAIKTRYKQLAKKYHPDINQNCVYSEEKLKEINQAYQVLKNKFFSKT